VNKDSNIFLEVLCSGTGRRRKLLLKVESGKMKIERPALEKSGAVFSCCHRLANFVA
jgi:hypothetical protein